MPTIDNFVCIYFLVVGTASFLGDLKNMIPTPPKYISFGFICLQLGLNNSCNYYHFAPWGQRFGLC